MGFNNGYDAGWQDAINAVKYGKVPGLGPASGDSGDDSGPARSPMLFSPGSDVYDATSGEIAPISFPLDVPSAKLQTSGNNGVVALSEPDGGFVTGDVLLLEVDSELSVVSSVTVGGAELTVSGASYNLYAFTGGSWVRFMAVSVPL